MLGFHVSSFPCLALRSTPDHLSFGPRTPSVCWFLLSAMTRIDVLQDDRGLAACFRGANLEQSWIESYTKFHQSQPWTTLST